MLHKDERRHEPQDEDLKGRLTTRRSAIDGAAWHEKSKIWSPNAPPFFFHMWTNLAGYPIKGWLVYYRSLELITMILAG